MALSSNDTVRSVGTIAPFETREEINYPSLEPLLISALITSPTDMVHI